MRRLSLLLCALLLGSLGWGGFHLLNAKPGHAVATACEVADDVEDVVYTDWHAQTTALVFDSYPQGPPSHQVGIDMWWWRVSHHPVPTSIDHCYRAAYASAWTLDGTGGYFTPWLHTAICQQVAYTWTKATQGNVNRADAETAQFPWALNNMPNIQRDVTLPSGVTMTLMFADYGPFPIENNCLPFGDTDGMEASSSTWSPTVLHSSPSSGWYCQTRNISPPGRPDNVYCP